MVNYIQEQFACTPSANCYHFRSHGGAEVDLILERDGALYPIEIKSKSRPTKSDASAINTFRQTFANAQIMPGLVVHAGEETYPLDQNTLALSWKALS